ncbi:Sodium/calcium exchanger protein [Fragilaria crotonensis]|nr:Sodium/calcium exchanger protein [Fragilaria crotonensis]
MLDCYETHNDDSASNGLDSPLDSSDEGDWTSISIKTSLLSLSDFPERDAVLLRLLKHSMADFQRDHKLTAELLEHARDWKCFQDVSFYRDVIACFLLDRVICNGRCDVRRGVDQSIDDHYDHSCNDWQRIELILGEALCTGLDEFTLDHAYLLCAFFKITLDTANPSAGEKDDEIVTNIGSLPSKSRKAKLKQAIYLWKMTDYDDDDSDDDSEENSIKEVIPYKVMREFVVALSRQAGINRHRRFESSQVMNSFCNSIGTLVFIGETSVRRLPAKYDSVEFCSQIVASFIGAYVHDWDYQEADSPYFISPGLPSVISPDRYANAINYATDRFLLARESELGKVGIGENRSGIYSGYPRVPNDVFDVIKSFFARDLASVDRAGCGYGDCLVWLGGEITGHDPFLFFSDTHNYPVGDDDDDDDEASLVWVYDEDKKPVSSVHLSARYDFTLLKLVQAWNAPWSPGRHHSFQSQFRAAVQTLFLCSNRLGLPQDIAGHIAKFLPRSFWPDERARCWCDDCSVDNSVSLMMWKLSGKVEEQKPKLQVTKLCDCKVAMYRNNEHRKRDSGQHRKWCQSIPLCIPGPAEERFCQIIDAKLKGEIVTGISQATQEIESEVQGDDDDDDDDDDEGSWESIDSEDEANEETKSTTEMIYDFFRKRSYRHHETEESAFEAMYS